MADAYALRFSEDRVCARLPGIALLVQPPRYYEEAHSVENSVDKVNV